MTISGTRCSVTPPCERSGTSSPDRSWRAADQVAHAIGRQFETFAALAVVIDRLDAVDIGKLHFQRADIGFVGQVDRRVGAQGAVMHDVGIGDRQDHARGAWREQCVEFVLQVDDVGLARGVVLGVHAMVGSQHDGRAERIEFGPVLVHHRVECIGAVAAGGELVLNVIGGRQVHQVRPHSLHQPDAGGENEFRQLGAVYRRHRHADHAEHVVDAVLGAADLV